MKPAQLLDRAKRAFSSLSLSLSLLEPVPPKSPQEGKLPYRPDIDGLRALAVLCVVAFHAFPKAFPGGFMGVDIFFVISGYLITSILLQDMERGSFRLAEFYMRRIRRIFPALIVVLFCVLAAAPLILFPDEYAMLGKHALGAAGFLSNIVLWRESGYFDVDSHTKVLLHFWSLGIEEQFYICFPLLLLVCFKKTQVLLPLALLFLLSFGETLYLGAADRTAAFYSPLSRAWELLAGALLSALHHSPRTRAFFLRLEGAYCAAQRGQTGNDRHAPGLVLAIAGGGCLALALGITDAKAVWPGWKTLLPVLGTVLLIAAGAANPVNRYLLSNRTAVFIGRISYPFYLWHWPLLVYAGFVTDTEQTSLLVRCILVCSAFLLASMTYFWVERPIRFQKKMSLQRIGGLCIALLSAGIWGGYMYINNHIDVINRTIPERLKGYFTESNFFPDIHSKDIISRSFVPIEDVTIAIIGDSHGGHLFNGLIDHAPYKQRIALFFAARTSPYLGIASITGQKQLSEFIEKAYELIFTQKNLKTVILAHNPTCSYGNIMDRYAPELKDQTQILENGMRRTFSALTKAGKNIIFILDTPHLPFDPKHCKKRPFMFSEDLPECSFPRALFDNDAAINWHNMVLRRVLKDYPAVTVIDLSPYLCDEALCYVVKGGKHFYKDNHHLSFEGSLLVAPEIIKHLDPAAPGDPPSPVTPAP